MRTTLDLDRELLERARRVLGEDSFTATIERALREVVERAESRKAWEELIASDLSWKDVDELIRYRRRYGGRAL